MYELAGDFINKYFNYADPIKMLPPASSYIIIPRGGIIMYGLAGGSILK